MTNWTAISPAKHAQCRWKPRENFSNVATALVVEVFATEISITPHHFPLGFVKNGDEYQLVALVGLDQGRNLYVDIKGRWISEYLPASLRCYPFILMDNENEEDEKTICIDQESITNQSNAHRLFNDEGEKDQSFVDVINFLIRCEQDRSATQKACSALASSGIIEPWPLNVQRGEGEGATKIEGLYRINEAKLNSLEPLEFASLRETGAFSLAYAQLFSMPQLSKLNRRYQFLALQKQQLDNNEEVANSIQDDVSLRLDQ